MHTDPWNRWWESYDFAGTETQKVALKKRLLNETLHKRMIVDWKDMLDCLEVPLQPACPPSLLTFPGFIFYIPYPFCQVPRF
jgi:hypothetical protein